MSGQTRPAKLSALHGIWLIVFAVDAALPGRGQAHQLGALALGLLFGVLLLSERRSSSD